jgi:D-alanine-D-alanine ligase
MHIGFTYDLRSEYLAAGYGEEETAEFDQLGTIEAIDEALQSLGHESRRAVGPWRPMGSRVQYL